MSTKLICLALAALNVLLPMSLHNMTLRQAYGIKLANRRRIERHVRISLCSRDSEPQGRNNALVQAAITLEDYSKHYIDLECTVLMSWGNDLALGGSGETTESSLISPSGRQPAQRVAEAYEHIDVHLHAQLHMPDRAGKEVSNA